MGCAGLLSLRLEEQLASPARSKLEMIHIKNDSGKWN